MPEFSSDWFTNNIPKWNKFLKPLAGEKLKALEIGSFEGRSALWLLENVLTHEGSTLTCVDHFLTRVNPKKDAYKTFVSNMKPYQKKVKVFKGYSRDVLKQSSLLKEMFDIIYIDASHHASNVLEDAVLAFPLLKPNGIMIFDDYTNNKEHDNNCPKPGIDAFLDVYAQQLRVLHSSWQVILKKRDKKLPTRPCYSELYREPRRKTLQ